MMTQKSWLWSYESIENDGKGFSTFITISKVDIVDQVPQSLKTPILGFMF